MPTQQLIHIASHRSRLSVVRLCWMLVLLMTVNLGCSRGNDGRVEVYPVAGSLSVRGKPADGALVVLHPKDTAAQAPNPRGKVAADGTFTLSTYEEGDGAPAGDYTLTVQLYRPIVVRGDVQPGPNVLPAKYGSPDSSDLSVTITAGTNRLQPITVR